MKITQILYKQHLGRLIRSIWYVKRERKIIPTKTEEHLRKLGILVKEPSEVFQKNSTVKEQQFRYLFQENLLYKLFTFIFLCLYFMLLIYIWIIFYIRIEDIQENFLKPRIVFDETHPDWKANSCLIFKDHNVLQEGIRQAQSLTNTIHLPDNSFSYIPDLLPDLPDHVDDIVKKYIKFSVFVI